MAALKKRSGGITHRRGKLGFRISHNCPVGLAVTPPVANSFAERWMGSEMATASTWRYASAAASGYDDLVERFGRDRLGGCSTNTAGPPDRGD